jgi:hypothetical protein
MPTPIDRDEVERLVRRSAAQVVEVLPSDVYEGEHLPSAINIPLKTLEVTYARSRFEGARRKAQKFGARGTTSQRSGHPPDATEKRRSERSEAATARRSR